MSVKNWFMLLLLGAIWGGSFLFAKVAVAEIPPLTLVLLRVGIAAATLHLVLKIRGERFQDYLALTGAFLMMGFLNNVVPFSLLFVGQTELSAGLASILNATTPIFTFVIAAVFLRQEPVKLHRGAGVAIGFLGVAIMLIPTLAGDGDDPLWAQLACLGAAVSYACAAAFAKRFKDTPPMISATGQLTASTAIMLPIVVLDASAWAPGDPSLVAWANVLALGVLATAGAYLLYFRLLANAGATNASLVTLIVPASAILFGYLLLDERLSAVQLAGFAMLLAGLIVLDGRIFATMGRKWRAAS